MAVEKRVYRYACAPTAEQEDMLLGWERVSKSIWNACITRMHTHLRRRETTHQWADKGKSGGKEPRFKPTAVSESAKSKKGKVYNLLHGWGQPPFPPVSAEFTALRNEFDFVKEMPRDLLDSIWKRLNQAKSAVFDDRKARLPRYKRRDDDFHLVFRADGGRAKIEKLNAKWGRVKLNGRLGWIPFRWEKHRLPEGCDLTTAMFKRNPKGWEVQIGWKGEISRVSAHPDRMVGLDRGVSVAVMSVDEEGESREFHLPESINGKGAPLNERLKELQRRLPRGPRAKKSARRKQVEMKGPDKKTGYLGSRRYRKARAQVAKTHHRIAAVRREWQHETAAAICREYGVVAVEALRTKDMTGSAKGTREKPGRRVKAKSGLNRAILAVGWDGLAHKIAYRGEVVEVSAAYTSQTCSECGHMAAGNRRTQAEFVCGECGFEANADWNAARNILRKGKEKRGGGGASADRKKGG